MQTEHKSAVTDYLRYRGKRVVVSGCYSGMGEATAKLLLEFGAEVHGFDYKHSQLALASFTPVDLRDSRSIDAGLARLPDKVDALFNCAGLPQTFPALDVMKVNYIGTRYLSEQMASRMSAGCAIVSVASTASLGWSRRMPVLMELIQVAGFESAVKWCQERADTVREGYSLSKEALVVWTMMAATQLIKRGIRLNCTVPGPTQTPMMAEFESATQASVIAAATQPINRRSSPEEQAAALVFLNSSVASYVNGVSFPVDGGFMGGIATGQIDPRSLMGGAASR